MCVCVCVCVCVWKVATDTHLEVLLQLARLQRRLRHGVVGRRELGRLVDVHQQHCLRDGGLGVQPRAPVAMPVTERQGRGERAACCQSRPGNATALRMEQSSEPQRESQRVRRRVLSEATPVQLMRRHMRRVIHPRWCFLHDGVTGAECVSLSGSEPRGVGSPAPARVRTGKENREDARDGGGSADRAQPVHCLVVGPPVATHRLCGVCCLEGSVECGEVLGEVV